MTCLAQLRDAFGRPLALRLDSVAVVEGAVDGLDARGDLWAEHPPGPYCRVTLVSGHQLYLDAEDARDVVSTLQAQPLRSRPEFPHLSHGGS